MRQRSHTTSNMRTSPPLMSKGDIHPLNANGSCLEVATGRRKSLSARSRTISDSKIALPPIPERKSRSMSKKNNPSDIGNITNIPKPKKIPYKRQTSLPKMQRSARDIRSEIVPESETLWTYVFESLRLPCLFSQEASFETLSKQTDFIKEILKHYDTPQRL